MRPRTSARYALILSLIIAGLLVLGSVQAQEQAVFRIGVLDDVRGPIANGVRLAIQQINNAGGVRGADGTVFSLQMVTQPTNFGLNLEAAVAALNQAGVIAVIGPETDEVVANGLLILQGMNVPVLVPATGDVLLVSDTTGRLFRTRAAEIWQGRALADYLINNLNVRQIVTAQLDIDSTAGVIGFTAAASALGVEPVSALLFTEEFTMQTLVQQVLQTDPQALVTYGSPALAAEFYAALRAGGWTGIFVYPDAEDENFRLAVPFEQLSGIIASSTWPFTATDPASEEFVDEFVRAFGYVPGEVEAAAYDSVLLIANGITRPGELRNNIAQISDLEAVQGILNPAGLDRGETSTNVSVVELGPFGAPVVLARYRGGQQLPPTQVVEIPTVIPPTPTPEGVVITIRSLRQNVRTGPGLEYPIIGQMNRDEQARVIGATPDNAWVVIDFRGTQGWLAAYLLDVFGDLNTVPIIQPPPTPTPGITPSPTIPPEADLIIESVSVSPQPITPGLPFTATILIRNAGLTPAGVFTVGANFPPNNINLSAVVAGLNPGQTIPVTLQGTLANTGFYTSSMLVDALNQVPEGVVGEANNTFNFGYLVDRALIRQGSQTLNLGDTLDLEGNLVQGDVNWNADGGLGLDGIFGGRLGVLPGTDLNQIHWDLINPAVVNRETIPRAEINPGMIIGVITADGNRGALRVENVNDSQLAVTFKVYSG